MAFSLAQRFVTLGVPSPLAIELAKQLESGVYSWQRLMRLGFIPELAKYVVTSVQDGLFDPVTAMRMGMTEATANLIAQAGGVALPPMPTLSPTSGSVNNTDGAGKIILNLPDLVEGETRTYEPIVGPEFVFGSDGDLIRGLVSFAGGPYSGRIIQNNGRKTLSTLVNITASDVPVIFLSQPPAQTADSTPPTVGFVSWNDHTVSGLTVTIKVNTVTNGTTVTDAQGAFTYEITPALSQGIQYTVQASVDAVGNPSAQTPVTVS